MRFDRQLPADERKRLGQFYTPRPVADLLAALTLHGDRPTILDPGCGDGEFLLAARAQSPHASLHGLDINPDAAAHAAARLRDISIPADIRCADFLSQDPTPTYDCILGNPPYVRSHHRSPHADRLQQIAARVHITPHAKTDLFAYFLFHALHFLTPNGRLGFVTPSSWLTAHYAPPIQSLLTSSLPLTLLLTSPTEPLIIDAALHPALLVASLDPPSSIKFVTLRQPLSSFSPAALAAELASIDRDHEDPRLRVKLVPRAAERAALALAPTTPRPWSLHLRPPSIFNNNPAFTPLDSLAHVALGYKSLQNDFYYLTPETIHHHAIEPEYLHPIFLLADLDASLYLQSPTPSRRLFLCRDADPAPGAARYIDSMAARPAPHRKQSSSHQSLRTALSAQGGRLWYAPKARPHAAQIWLRKAIDGVHAPLLFPTPAVVDQRCNSLTPIGDLPWQLLAAVLTATTFALALELHGAANLGAGALEAATTRLRRFPVFDPRPLSPADRDELTRLATAVHTHEPPVDWRTRPSPGPLLRALDSFILARAAPHIPPDTLYRDLHAAVQTRVAAARPRT